METIQFDLDERDDIQFINAVHPVILGAVALTAPPDVYTVKVDNWFGSRWLLFSHKAIGAFGVASYDLRIPPFIPARIVSEKYWVRTDEATYQSTVPPLQLHVYQHSGDNAHRAVARLCPSAALFWWSGNTKGNGRGSIMAYLPASSGHIGWYAEFKADESGDWRSALTRQTSRSELDRYAQHAPHND